MLPLVNFRHYHNIVSAMQQPHSLVLLSALYSFTAAAAAGSLPRGVGPACELFLTSMETASNAKRFLKLKLEVDCDNRTNY